MVHLNINISRNIAVDLAALSKEFNSDCFVCEFKSFLNFVSNSKFIISRDLNIKLLELLNVVDEFKIKIEKSWIELSHK